MRNFPTGLALVLSLMLGACSSAEEESGAETNFTAADVTFKPLAFAVPKDKAAVDQSFVFDGEEGFRQFFGESCGLLCKKPYAGAMPASLQDAPGVQRLILYVNRRDVPTGKQLVVRSVEQGSSREWLRITTCTRPGVRQSSALVSVQIQTKNAAPSKVTADDEDDGLRPCR